MSETGLLSGEAAINSTGISYLLKAITQRPRPLEDNGNGTFFQGGHSLSIGAQRGGLVDSQRGCPRVSGPFDEVPGIWTCLDGHFDSRHQ